MKHAGSQAGNVFFIILVGIVLFAAFSAAVLRTTSQSGGSTNPERDKLDASLIVKYGNTVKSAVDQLRTLGVSESQISFANGTVTGYGTVGTNPTYEVFNSSGGAIVYETPNSRWLDSASAAQTSYGEWVFTGTNFLFSVGTPGNGACSASSCSELVAILPYVKQSICQQINNMLSAPDTQDSGTFGLTKYTGTFSSSPTGIGTNSTAEPTSRLSYCFEGGGSPARYYYVQVLIAR